MRHDGDSHDLAHIHAVKHLLPLYLTLPLTSSSTLTGSQQALRTPVVSLPQCQLRLKNCFYPLCWLFCNHKHLLLDSQETVTMGNKISQKETEKCKFQKLRHKFTEHLIQLEPALKEDDLRDEVDSDNTLDKIDPGRYDLPFENLAFEGGGNKGLAHAGAVKYLEEIGALSNIIRLAGASAGSLMAVLIAVGCQSRELQVYMEEDWSYLMRDGGFLGGLRNMVKRFGWHPGNRVYDWLGEILRKRTGSEDITFEEVRKKYGREVCVVVTNLNLMTAEYCHPKTTPDMPIRVAVRMSMSIPGLFTPIEYYQHGSEDTFIDGGVLCNYPVHCFDGWFLSMDKSDNFITRLQPLEDLPILYENRFRPTNSFNKTLGFLLYSDAERDYLRPSLERKVGPVKPVKPSVETKLYKKWLEQREDMMKSKRIHERITDAMNSFLKVIDECNMDKGKVINREELENALKRKSFTKDQADILFGEDASPEEAFRLLDQDGTGQIHYSELVSFMEDLGINIRHRSIGFRRSVVNSIPSYVNSILNTLLINVKRITTKPSDIDRTVGINTGHVDTTDFEMEEADKEFLSMRGYNSCRAFLQHFIADNNLQPKEDKDTPEDTKVANMAD
ncbi:uncharacterized protein LOC124135044 [Haliotis rufescens]|uniref:uncharacterized protein LOC124135044 n=1 Tax=Haliotis rufescens TaxID=6454 RepID=UPI00201E7F4F|nr:uncharacterized protein LOC124135044 [Haliotis rufescens]